MKRPLLSLFVVSILSATTYAADWTQWGGDASRNMVSDTDMKIPTDFVPGDYLGRTDQIDPSTMKKVKWVAKLGSQAYGNPTVANGRVFVGTNNDSPRNEKLDDDRSCIYAFDEQTGEYLWQIAIPKLGAGKVSDWEFLGICSSPAVNGDFVYFMSNLCEVICLDVNGLADGNQGAQDEAAYLELPEGVSLGKNDADVIWRYDMRRELGIFPHNITSSSPLVVGDHIYASTSNGVDWSHVDIPNTQAPALIKLDGATGELLGEEASGISQNIMHCNWSSPAYAEIDGRKMVIFGAGDGFTYGFSPEPVKDEEGFMVFKELWKVDCTKPYRLNESGEPIKYATAPGPSEIISTPVVYNGKVYSVIGQDPEHGEGVGALTCIDPTKTGDATESGGIVWQFRDIHRSISTPSIRDGLVFIADYSGFIYCIDAETGEFYWKHDTFAHIWGSTMVADGKVFIGNEDGYLTILEASKTKKVLAEIEFPSPIYSTPVIANKTMYVGTATHLFAIGE